MYVSSKLATVRVLAIAFAITLWALGVPTLQAVAAGHGHHSDHDGSHSSCQPEVQTSCPAPVKVEKPKPVTQCCPVIDPHKQHEADEAAAHAQHEAAEDCARNQKAAEHAQHEADEAQAKADKKLAKVQELQAGLCCQPVEPVAEAPIAQPEVERAKPMPEPEPPVVFQPEPTPAVIIEQPAPTPEPPKQLPRTASGQELLGLIGLVSMTGGLTGFFRRNRKGYRD